MLTISLLYFLSLFNPVHTGRKHLALHFTHVPGEYGFHTNLTLWSYWVSFILVGGLNGVAIGPAPPNHHFFLAASAERHQIYLLKFSSLNSRRGLSTPWPPKLGLSDPSVVGPCDPSAIWKTGLGVSKSYCFAIHFNINCGTGSHLPLLRWERDKYAPLSPPGFTVEQHTKHGEADHG